MFKRTAIAAIVFGVLAAAPPTFARSQNVCAPRDKVVSDLQAKYFEARKGAGLANATSLLEIWTSAKTGSWTVIITRSTGTSCILASGNTWMDDAPKIVHDGDPA